MQLYDKIPQEIRENANIQQRGNDIMGNIALQLERTISGGIAPEEIVIFDIVSHSTGNITYNSETGSITFEEPGRYRINWTGVMQSSSYSNGIVFAFTSGNGTAITGNTNVKTGEVVGIGILEVTEVPAVFTLQNSGTGNYYFSDTVPVKASLVITQDNINEAADSYCFAIDQMINILAQMINTYSENIWTVYTQSLYYYSGMPFELYTAPGADKPGLLRLIDVNGDYEAIPIEHIAAVYPGDGTVYDPGFTYLSLPDSLPHDCNYDLLAAIQAYLPAGTTAVFGLGPSISASGDVYRDEYGLVVLSDEAGNTPVFIAAANILRIFITGSGTGSRKSSGKPQIRLEKD